MNAQEFTSAFVSSLTPEQQQKYHVLTAALLERIAKLESYLDHTADGKLVIECEKLYCPKCGDEVKQNLWVAYCWACPNPDDGGEIPLPLSYGLCLAEQPKKEL